jgi:hypothetical protein
MVYSLTPRYIQNLYVRVCSRLLDSKDECKRLWYLLRASDEAGAGSAAISILEATVHLGCTVQTFYRLLRQGMGVWFRGSQVVGDGLLRIYYRGIRQVCLSLRIKQVGAIAWTDAECFTRFGAKAVSSELEAAHRQQQAVWNAKKYHEPYEVIEPAQKASSVNSIRGKYAFSYGDFVIPGASLDGIAKPTEWSPYTHKKRLNNRNRIDHGVDPVIKVRVAHQVGEGDRLSDMGIDGDCFVVRGSQILRTFSFRSGIFELGTNIYGSEHELLSCRFLRSKISGAWRDKGRNRNAENGCPTGLVNALN